MGVAESSIKNFNTQAVPDRQRIWGNMLYTWYMVEDKQPAYFSKAYDQNYFKEKGQVADGYMQALHEE